MNNYDLRKSDLIQEEEQIFAQRLSNYIFWKYEEIIGDEIDEGYMSLRGMVSDDEANFIKSIPLRFNAQYSEYIAFASYEDNSITYNLNSEIEGRIENTLIHELAHLIANKYGINSKHTLDFAVLTYCLQNKISCLKENFFRAYDIHEDEVYPYLTINPFLFDRLIKQIDFKSIKDLCEKSRNLARLIRKQALAIPLSKINGEVEI